MNEWTNESKPEWPQRGSKAKIYSPLATRKDLCCCSLGVSVWGRGAPAGSSQGRPLSGWLAGPWPPSSLRGRGPVSVAEKAGPRGGAPAPGEGLRSRLRPARVSSRGLGWREGAGLPGRRDGAGVSAIDRTGRCREAFRPASASRRGGGGGGGSGGLGFPSPTWGRLGASFVASTSRPVASEACRLWSSDRNPTAHATAFTPGAAPPAPNFAETLFPSSRFCCLRARHVRGSWARSPPASGTFPPEGLRRIPALSPPPLPQALFRFLSLWVSLAFWRISCQQKSRGRSLGAASQP